MFGQQHGMVINSAEVYNKEHVTEEVARMEGMLYILEGDDRRRNGSILVSDGNVSSKPTASGAVSARRLYVRNALRVRAVLGEGS